MNTQTYWLTTLRTATLLVILIPLGSGCTALQTGSSLGMQSSHLAEGTEGDASAQVATISLEVRPAGRREPEMQQVPLHEAMHVQDLLEQTGLTRRFRRMELHLMRPTGADMAKMRVQFSHQAGRVDPLFDYALRPGDHVVVIEDTSTVLDDMLQSLNPLASTRRN